MKIINLIIAFITVGFSTTSHGGELCTKGDIVNCVLSGSVKELNDYIKSGGNLNAIFNWPKGETVGMLANGTTLLMLAAQAKTSSLEMTTALVDANADMTLTDEDDMTALNHAVDNDNLHTARYLISKGASKCDLSYEQLSKIIFFTKANAHSHEIINDLKGLMPLENFVGRCGNKRTIRLKPVHEKKNAAQ